VSASSTSLVIPAGGRGLRFGAAIPKQYLPLLGRSVLAWSLRAFAGEIGEAVIAAAGEDAQLVAAAIREADLAVPVRVVPGGDTRMASVAAAVAATTLELVLVHDAVRPLVERSAIAACREALARHGAALVAVPCASTVKSVHDRVVLATVPRSRLWLAQTPQGFRRALGLAAYAQAAAEGWECSDDAEVLERAGTAPLVVPGSATNLKITEPGDLELAAAILRGRPGSTFPPGP
jgi:2-C-methyl-D-erythritol 4-phosphate cytidylyltransferase